MRKHTVKNKFGFVLIVVLLVISAFLLVGATHFSNGENQAGVEYTFDNVQYHFFSNATNSMAHHGGILYIADGDTIYTYTQNIATGQMQVTPLFSVSAPIRHIHVADFGGSPRFFVIYTTGAVGAYGQNGDPLPLTFPSSISNGGFTSIITHAGWLYAAAGNSMVVFDAQTGIYDRVATVPEARIIVGLAEGSGLLFVSYLTAGDDFEILPFIFAPAAIPNDRPDTIPIAVRGGMLSDEFLQSHFIESEGALFVWAADIIYRITLNPRGDQFPATVVEFGSYSSETTTLVTVAATNSHIYALSGIRKLTRYRISNLLQGEILLASRSDIIPGFFSTPRGVATNSGRVFVADSINTRISIQDRDGFYYMNVTAPRAVAARDEMLVVVHSVSTISFYDISDGEEDYIRSLTFPSQIPVDIELCSSGDLFVLTATGQVFMLSGGEFVEVPGLGGATVLAISARANASGMYAAIRSGADTIIARLTETGFYEILTVDGLVVDFAVDVDRSLAILRHTPQGPTVARYYNNPEVNLGTGFFNSTQEFELDSQLFLPSRIIISTVDFRQNSLDTNALANRDYLLVDHYRHRVKRIATSLAPFYYAGADMGIFEIPFNEYLGQENLLIHSLSGTAQLFMSESSAFPLMRTRNSEDEPSAVVIDESFFVLLPFGISNTDFSFVVVDKIQYQTRGGEQPVLFGFIRSNLILPPLEYQNPSRPTVATASKDYTKIYRLPVNGFPSYITVGYNTPLTLLSFTYFENENGREFYGYFDNRHAYPENIRPLLSNNYRWFRVSFVCEITSANDNEVVRYGFVPFNSVIIYGAPFGELDPNAIIIRASFDTDDGAVLFEIDGSGELVRDDEGEPVRNRHIEYIDFGAPVMVIGAFDSSANFHRIRFEAEFGVLDAIVRTPNLEYEGLDVLRVVAAVLAGVIVILGGLAIGRYLYVKKKTFPKQPVDKYI